MSVESRYQGGAANESTFATYATPTRFYEVTQDTVVPQYGRIETAGLRSGTFSMRSDRVVPYILGGTGDISLEVLTKGFGYWLQHMVGAVATTGPNGDGRYTHTGKLGSLAGKSFTWQGNRPFNPADTDQPFNFLGGKISSWELSNTQGGLLLARFSCDFADFDTSNALAAVSYPTGAELFSFVGATITVAGVAFDATNFKVGLENQLKVDRRFLRANAVKKEQYVQALRVPTWSCDSDFSDMTQLNRIKAATSSGISAQIIATWQGPTLIGGTSYPTLTVTLPAARFDEGFPTVNGPGALSQQLKGKALDAGSGPITIAYGTVDSTP